MSTLSCLSPRHEAFGEHGLPAADKSSHQNRGNGSSADPTGQGLFFLQLHRCSRRCYYVLRFQLRDSLYSVMAETQGEISLTELQGRFRKRWGEGVQTQRAFGCSLEDALETHLVDIISCRRVAGSGRLSIALRRETPPPPPLPSSPPKPRKLSITHNAHTHPLVH